MSTRDYTPFVDPNRVPRIDKASCRLSLSSYPPAFERLLGVWGPLSRERYCGITTDGRPAEGLFGLEEQGAPVTAAVHAAQSWLASLDEATRSRVRFSVTSDAWRHWQNTPLVLRDPQVELEELSDRQRALALEIVRASLSERGYERTLDVVANNAFIGEVNQLTDIMNAWSFTMSIFGDPSVSEPWGWQLFGHHLALNCLFIGGQMVLSPVFMGMEPDIGCDGRRRLFEQHEEAALTLMRSFGESERRKAILYDSMLTADQPADRYHPDDGRMVGGAFQDNRIVPYEGLAVAGLGAAQRRNLLDLAEIFIESLPIGPAGCRLREIERYLDQTRFAWIGKVDDISPFYFRIHSPVVLLEFDHHSGIFLANEEPERFHVHTVMRTPNGNDYGVDILRQHYAQGGHERGDRGVHAHTNGSDGQHSHDGGHSFHSHR